MRKLTACLFTLALGGACMAQQWEIGAAGGIGVYKNLTVTRGSDTASAGFKDGVALSAFATQNLYQHLGGQIRYTFQFDDMKVSSGGTEATFGAQSHAIHYDLLFYGTRREAVLRPFLAAGPGVKIYRGTGSEQVSQPLAKFAILSRTQQATFLVSVGGGLKFKLGRRSFLTLEVHDYITSAPKNVIVPFTGSKMSGWVHDFMPMVALSFGF